MSETPWEAHLPQAVGGIADLNPQVHPSIEQMQAETRKQMAKMKEAKEAQEAKEEQSSSAASDTETQFPMDGFPSAQPVHIAPPKVSPITVPHYPHYKQQLLIAYEPVVSLGETVKKILEDPNSKNLKEKKILFTNFRSALVTFKNALEKYQSDLSVVTKQRFRIFFEQNKKIIKQLVAKIKEEREKENKGGNRKKNKKRSRRKIRINPKMRGVFTRKAKKKKMSVQKYARYVIKKYKGKTKNKRELKLLKQAVFAKTAKKWKSKKRKKTRRKQKGAGLLDFFGFGSSSSTSDTLREIAEKQQSGQKVQSVTQEEQQKAADDGFQLLDSKQIQEEQDAAKEQKRREADQAFYVKRAQEDWDNVKRDITLKFPSGGEGNPFLPDIGLRPTNFETAEYFEKKLLPNAKRQANIHGGRKRTKRRKKRKTKRKKR